MEWTKAIVHDHGEGAEVYREVFGALVAEIVKRGEDKWEWMLLDHGDPLEHGEASSSAIAQHTLTALARAYATIHTVRQSESLPESFKEEALLARYPALVAATRARLQEWIAEYLGQMEHAVADLESHNAAGKILKLREDQDPGSKQSLWDSRHDHSIATAWAHWLAVWPRQHGRPIGEEPLPFGGGDDTDAPLDDIELLMGKREAMVEIAPQGQALYELLHFILSSEAGREAFAAFVDEHFYETHPCLNDIAHPTERIVMEELKQDPKAQALAKRMQAGLKARAELARGLGRKQD